MEEIAELLKLTREESGIDLEEVSKDLGISEVILDNIEDGKIGAFKDIFVLKNHITNYAKYLGLDSDKISEEFNEYLFEYTSKIPVKEIEKNIEMIAKEAENEKIISPYTANKPKNKKLFYIVIYLLILLLVILTIFWSINQITIDKKNAYIVSYRK